MRAGVRLALFGWLGSLGMAVAARSQVAFPPPVNVSNSADGSYVPSLVIPSAGPAAGDAQVFWHDFTGGSALIWCASGAGGGWQVEGPCPPNVDVSFTPRAAVDSQGVVHLVWRDRTADDIYHACLDAGTWSVPEVVAATPGESRNPAIAVDRRDLVHVLWEDASSGAVRIWEAHHDGVSWSAGADSGLRFAQDAHVDVVRIACDSAGTLHALWHDGLPTESFREIYHAERPPGGPWRPTENVSATPGHLSAEPALAFASDDTLHCAWVEQDQFDVGVFEINHAAKPAGGAWTSRIDVSRQLTLTSRPSVAVGRDGLARIAWRFQAATGTDIAYVGFPGDVPSNASATDGVSSNAPSLALDGDDAPWIAWQEGIGPTAEILATTTAVRAAAVLLFVAKDEVARDALLTWTGGTAPHVVVRSPVPEPAGPWTESTPPGGIAPPAWSDAGVLDDGATWYYLVR